MREHEGDWQFDSIEEAVENVETFLTSGSHEGRQELIDVILCSAAGWRSLTEYPSEKVVAHFALVGLHLATQRIRSQAPDPDSEPTINSAEQMLEAVEEVKMFLDDAPESLVAETIDVFVRVSAGHGSLNEVFAESLVADFALMGLDSLTRLSRRLATAELN